MVPLIISVQCQTWFTSSTEITTTVVSASKDSLTITLASYHRTTLTLKGAGYGRCVAKGGLLHFNAWKDFLSKKLHAKAHVGDNRFWVWFTLDDTPIAFYEGEVTGTGAFVGEGDTTWTY